MTHTAPSKVGTGDGGRGEYDPWGGGGGGAMDWLCSGRLNQADNLTVPTKPGSWRGLSVHGWFWSPPQQTRAI